MVYSNTDYANNQEQYIENCNEYGFNNYQQNQQAVPYRNNFGQLATPHSSLENSRQNSYEKDERQYYNNYYNSQYQEFSPTYENGEMNEGDYDDGALFYNSRPMK
jgi:hypothetical protein